MAQPEKGQTMPGPQESSEKALRTSQGLLTSLPRAVSPQCLEDTEMGKSTMPVPQAPTAEETSSLSPLSSATTSAQYLSKPQAYRILQSYLHHNGFGQWQKQMFDKFVTKHVPSSVMEHTVFTCANEATRTRHTITISNVRVEQPSTRHSSGDVRASTALDCQVTRSTYSLPLVCDAIYTREPLAQEDLQKVHTANEQAAKRRRVRTAVSGTEGQDSDDNDEDAGALPDPQIVPLTETVQTVLHNLEIDRIPCMVDSPQCARRASLAANDCVLDPMDVGCYFVVDGARKLLVGQEWLLNNHPVVTEREDTYVCEVRSNAETRLRSSSTLYIQLVPCLPLQKLPTVESRRIVDCCINVRLPYGQYVPAAQLFIAIDVLRLPQMLDLICVSTDPTWFWSFVSDALLFGATNTSVHKSKVYAKIKPEKAGNPTALQQDVDNLIKNEFLPHQGTTPEDLPMKAALLGKYIRKLALVYLLQQPTDDRDHYRFRRNVSITFMSLLFRDACNQWRTSVQQAMVFELNRNVCKLDPRTLLAGTMGRRLVKALKTGNMSIHHTRDASVATAGQQLATTEYMASVAHVLRTNASHSESAAARQIHEQTGVVDPFDTPDGQNVGQTRNMSAFAGVRAGHATDDLCRLVKSFLPMVADGVPVLVNGRLIGHVDDPYVARDCLRELRAAQEMPADVSLFVDRFAEMDPGSLNICGDAGAFYWPLLRVDRLDKLPHILQTTATAELWPRLLREGVAELVGKDEEYWHARVATYQHEIPSLPGVTHVMIDAIQPWSIYVQKSAHAHFNQAPRNAFATGMFKQTCGRPSTVPTLDTCSNVLVYPQRSMVTTAFDHMVGVNTAASFQNCMVAVACWNGLNVEDALVIKRSAVERGLGRTIQSRTFHDQCTVREGEREIYCVPPEGTLSRVVGKTHKINPLTGFVDPGVFVTPDDVIISKVSERKVGTKNATSFIYHDHSCVSKHSGQIERVIKYKTPTGSDAVMITIRATKIPQVGDKFASRHAQKTSVACVANDVDLPFVAATGEIPDVIVNPHAMPSRMTMGHLMETLHTKLAFLIGQEIDGSPCAQGVLANFSEAELMASASNRSAVVDAVGKMLASLGVNRSGRERMIDGTNGEHLQGEVFMGPLSYFRLKHMVEDKQHARARGPVNAKTRQPEEGRSKNGGLRVGEMERDALLSHGAAATTLERLCKSSDATRVHICTKCGFPTHNGARLDGKRSFCRLCVDYTGVEVEVPFVVLLHIEELRAGHMALRCRVSESK